MAFMLLLALIVAALNFINLGTADFTSFPGCTWTTWSEPVYAHGPTSTYFSTTVYIERLYDCHGCTDVKVWPLGHAFLTVTYTTTVTARQPTYIDYPICSLTPPPAQATSPKVQAVNAGDNAANKIPLEHGDIINENKRQVPGLPNTADTTSTMREFPPFTSGPISATSKSAVTPCHVSSSIELTTKSTASTNNTTGCVTVSRSPAPGYSTLVTCKTSTGISHEPTFTTV